MNGGVGLISRKEAGLRAVWDSSGIGPLIGGAELRSGREAGLNADWYGF